MIAIRHCIGINAPQHQVHPAFATVAGVASWWTHDVTGDDTVGGKLLLYFGRPEPRLVLEVVPFLAHCSTKWAYFLLGVKAMFEGGQATPFPGDLKISSWG